MLSCSYKTLPTYASIWYVKLDSSFVEVIYLFLFWYCYQCYCYCCFYLGCQIHGWSHVQWPLLMTRNQYTCKKYVSKRLDKLHNFWGILFLKNIKYSPYCVSYNAWLANKRLFYSADIYCSKNNVFTSKKCSSPETLFSLFIDSSFTLKKLERSIFRNISLNILLAAYFG